MMKTHLNAFNRATDRPSDDVPLAVQLPVQLPARLAGSLWPWPTQRLLTFIGFY